MLCPIGKVYYKSIVDRILNKCSIEHNLKEVKMLKRNSVLFLAILLVGFSGCKEIDLSVPGLQAKKPPVQKPVEITKLKILPHGIEAQKSPIVKNGAIIMPNNERILDENGDIIQVYHANQEYFYLLQTRKTFKLKNLATKKVIKEFEKPVDIQSFQDTDGFLLAIKWNLQSNVYDNIYSFDGKNLKLINKNIVIPFGSGVHGTYALKGVYKHIEGSLWAYQFQGYYIVNILSGKVVEIKPQYSKLITMILFGTHKSTFKNIIGIIDDNIFYTYKDTNGKDVLEVYNGKTNSQKTILETNNRLQFLKYGNQVVVKIFNDKNLKAEHVLGNTNIKTRYANMPAKYISLNLLANVSGVSQDFEPIVLKGNYANTPESYITYNFTELNRAFSHFKQSGTLKLLF